MGNNGRIREQHGKNCIQSTANRCRITIITGVKYEIALGAETQLVHQKTKPIPVDLPELYR